MSTQFNFQKTLLLLIGFSIVLVSSFAQAQNKKKRFRRLSDDNVREFIQDTTAITSVQNVQDDAKAVNRYLDRHIDPDARFVTSISYIMPGMPEQEKSLSLSKDDYIEQVKQGAGSVEHYHSEITVDNVDISKDKETASVSTISSETGVMQVPQEDGSMQGVPIEGKSECFQVLKIGKKGYIQMYSANCKTVMEFKPY